MFDTYVPSDHKLETCAHIVLTYGEVQWDPENVTMDINMPYKGKACVAEMSRNHRKGSPGDIFHNRNLILGSITDSLVEDIAL